MLDSEVKVGAKIICTNKEAPFPYDNCFNNIGIIRQIDIHKARRYISILWENGTCSFLATFVCTDFELYVGPALANNHSINPKNYSLPSEAPCKVCSKMNDIGVRKCWNCENIIG